jgi:hypothetical protein
VTTKIYNGKINTMIRIFALSILILFPSAVIAQTITQTQALSFGTIAIDNITDNVSLNIQNSGGYNANANTFVIDPPTRGQFLLTGGPASTVYTVTTPVSTTLGGPGPATFLMDNFRVRPNTLITNASGTDTFRIMARIRSTSGDSFGDGDYDDTFNIMVNF